MNMNELFKKLEKEMEDRFSAYNSIHIDELGTEEMCVVGHYYDEITGEIISLFKKLLTEKVDELKEEINSVNNLRRFSRIIINKIDKILEVKDEKQRNN